MNASILAHIQTAARRQALHRQGSAGEESRWQTAEILLVFSAANARGLSAATARKIQSLARRVGKFEYTHRWVDIGNH